MNEVPVFPSTSIPIILYFQLHNTSHQLFLIRFFFKSSTNTQKQVNSDPQEKDSSLLPKQSRKPPLHKRCPLLSPKETLAVAFPLNTHALGLFSPWKSCSTDPSDTLWGSAGRGRKGFEKEKEWREISAFVFPSEYCISFWNENKNQRIGSGKDIKLGLTKA